MAAGIQTAQDERLQVLYTALYYTVGCFKVNSFPEADNMRSTLPTRHRTFHTARLVRPLHQSMSDVDWASVVFADLTLVRITAARLPAWASVRRIWQSGAVYRPLIGWLSGREHLQVRFIRTLIQKERYFPEASSAVSCSCRRGSPGTAPAGHSMLGFMNGGYVRLSSTPAPSKSTNRTS